MGTGGRGLDSPVHSTPFLNHGNELGMGGSV